MTDKIENTEPDASAEVADPLNEIVMPDEPLIGDYIPAPELPYTQNDYVTRTGADIHLVIDLDDECYFGQFKCVYESGDIYTVGEIEGNMGRRYAKVTNEFYPELYAVAIRHGWLKA